MGVRFILRCRELADLKVSTLGKSLVIAARLDIYQLFLQCILFFLGGVIYPCFGSVFKVISELGIILIKEEI